MKSLVNTPPSSRNALSLRSASRDSSSEPGIEFIFAILSSERSYMLWSTGAGGSIFFFTPSRPAISIAENALYGFAVGSGQRYSILFALGFSLYMGILTAALLFLLLYTRFTGAS